MTKAEEKALKAYPPTHSEWKRNSKRVRSALVDTHQPLRTIFQRGYEQAEKEIKNHLLDTLQELSSEPGLLEEALELVAEYNLQPYRDGNAWCILLGKDIQSGICGFGDTLTETYLGFLKSYKEYQHPIGELLNGLQEPEVPKEICPRCIHYGEYCYQPGGGMQYKINENGVYDCTHFNEKEQSANDDLEEEIAGMYQALFGTDIINRKEMLYLETFHNIARHFAEWGAKNAK